MCPDEILFWISAYYFSQVPHQFALLGVKL